MSSASIDKPFDEKRNTQTSQVRGRPRSKPRGITLLSVLVITTAATVHAQETPANPLALGDANIYQQSLTALTILFVVAVLLESALAVIFNWRVFLTFFNLRGIRTLVMIAVSWATVSVFDINVVAALLAAYSKKPPETEVLSSLLTALILAGGSSGIHNLMVALGFRDASRERQHTPQPPKTQAWLAVRVTRKNAAGPINLSVSKSTSTPPSATPPELAGTLTTTRASLKDLFLRNRDRFPQSGGYVVAPGVAYDLALDARDADGNPVPSAINGTYAFAPGAIVDFEVTL